MFDTRPMCPRLSSRLESGSNHAKKEPGKLQNPFFSLRWEERQDFRPANKMRVCCCNISHVFIATLATLTQPHISTFRCFVNVLCSKQMWWDNMLRCWRSSQMVLDGVPTNQCFLAVNFSAYPQYPEIDRHGLSSL